MAINVGTVLSSSEDTGTKLLLLLLLLLEEEEGTEESIKERQAPTAPVWPS